MFGRNIRNRSALSWVGGIVGLALIVLGLGLLVGVALITPALFTGLTAIWVSFFAGVALSGGVAVVIYL